jgi:hypothetical protein
MNDGDGRHGLAHIAFWTCDRRVSRPGSTTGGAVHTYYEDAVD